MNKIALTDAIKQFLYEDINYKDITTTAIFPEHIVGTATIQAKADGILSGVDILSTTFQLLDNDVQIELLKNDGDLLLKGDRIATIKGSIRAMLTGERVALNLLQKMSGIATLTATAVATLNNPNINVTDTRKTTPGLRMFEKYAITCGGGVNHRFSLSDMVMIKDNHIAFAGSITNAVTLVRKQLGPVIKIEVETETAEQVREAVANNVDIIMFDNRTPEEINELSRLVPETILTEASGGITIHDLHRYRHTNVDFISLGWLTHSVHALDISLIVEGE